MAKPVLIIQFPFNEQVATYAKEIKTNLEASVGNEYHVLLFCSNTTEVKVDCYNDCKGLLNKDIAKLANRLINQVKQSK